MMPLCLYDISGWPWQRVLHVSIFLHYHLRRLVLSSLHVIPAHFTRGTCAIVSLVIIGISDFKRWGRGQFHYTLTRWPAHRLRPFRSNSSRVECHDGRESGMPIYWTHRFSHVCGTLARWPADCLRLGRWNNNRTWNITTRETVASHLLGTWIQSSLWYSCQMASGLSRQDKDQF